MIGRTGKSVWERVMAAYTSETVLVEGDELWT